MKVLIAAGGTGGHIFPGIAVANEIMHRDPASEVLFVGTVRGLETRIVPESGYQLSLIDSSGLKSVGLKGMLKGLALLPKSFIEARQIIRQFRPHVVVGAGGYVSGPVLLMAAIMGVPTLVMDSNALPGFANRRLARFVDKAALTFDEAVRFFGKKGVVTGNPVRQEFFDIPERTPNAHSHILIFGGSQGSRALNNAMAEALTELEPLAGQLTITHQTGEADFEKVRAEYAASEFSDADIRPFITDMPAEFAKAEIIVCRAGATTCAELAASGRVAIMIPLPTAADDHQRKNAESLVNAGAAKMILQNELSGHRLAAEIKRLLDEPAKLVEMARSVKQIGRPDAAERIVDLIEELQRNV